MEQKLFRVIVKNDRERRECLAAHFFGDLCEVLINGKWVAMAECELEFVELGNENEELSVKGAAEDVR